MFDRVIPGTTPEAPRHYTIKFTGTKYHESLITVDMCKYPYEGQICAVKGGIRPLFKSLILWEGPRYDRKVRRYVPLYKGIRSYYV